MKLIMNFRVISLLILVVFSMVVVIKGHTVYKDADEAAAECLSMGQDCSTNQTILAPACVPGLSLEQQSVQCVRSGCFHCLGDKFKYSHECQKWEIETWCPVLRDTGVGGAAARCLHLQDKCGGWLLSRSKHCAFNTSANLQPPFCKRAACAHCNLMMYNLSSRDVPPQECTRWSIEKICSENKNKLASPSPTFKPLHSHRYIRQCVYKSERNRLVISLKDTPVNARWTRIITDGFHGLTWRANDNRIWPSRPGSGEMCYKTKFAHFGSYFLTAMTSGAGKRDYNDLFIRFSGDLNFLNARTNRRFPFRIRARNSYFKAYQNIGENRRTKVLSTINGTPHILVTHPIRENKEYTLCISGRSSRFSVYSLIMIRCEELNCMRTSEYIQQNLRNNTPSACVEE